MPHCAGFNGFNLKVKFLQSPETPSLHALQQGSTALAFSSFQLLPQPSSMIGSSFKYEILLFQGFVLTYQVCVCVRGISDGCLVYTRKPQKSLCVAFKQIV